MASRAENRVVNLAGLVQGITLVTFPAASSVFTDPTEYDLSSTQYGAMFGGVVLRGRTAPPPGICTPPSRSREAGIPDRLTR